MQGSFLTPGGQLQSHLSEFNNYQQKKIALLERLLEKKNHFYNVGPHLFVRLCRRHFYGLCLQCA
jgi:hypothetical protein